MGVPAFYFISSAVTILATVLVIHRIISFAQRSEGGGSSSYTFIVEVMVESGVMYAVSLMVTSISYVVVKNGSFHAVKLAEMVLLLEQVLVPITVRMYQYSTFFQFAGHLTPLIWIYVGRDRVSRQHS